MQPHWFARASVGAFTLLLLISLSVPLAAQDTGRIVGRVTSEGNGQPLLMAQIMVERLGLRGLTSSGGQFLICRVPVGTHAVQVELFGYLSVQQQATVSAGGTATLNFTLISRRSS